MGEEVSALNHKGTVPKALTQNMCDSFFGAYTPDLGSFISICEMNYLLTQKIVEAVGGVNRKGDTARFGLLLNSQEMGIVDISLIEKSRYTSTYIFHQIHPTSDWLPGTEFKIQFYHDAHMVEVIQYQGCNKLDAKYQYPNKCMHQRDEKYQSNRLFYEWLSFCLNSGCLIESPYS